MPRKKRRKSRKKGGSFLKALMPTCWEMGEGKRKPIGETERNCCCGSYTCRNNYPDECRGYFGKLAHELKQNIIDRIETIKDNAEKKKREKVYKYHTTRTRNKGKGEPVGLYGSHCVNSKGEKWGWKRALKGERDWDPSRGGDYLNPDGTAKAQICRGGNCSNPANNIKYIPIQHRTNWTAPPKAFEKPSHDYKPGKVRDDGLVCRPDWGSGPKWEGEWCLLDPVGFSFRGKENTEKANRQTCLTKYAKNWEASSLAAMAEGKYFDDEAQAAEIDSAYKKDYWHVDNMLKRIKKEREEKEAAKKKLVTDKVQAQAHAFAEKQNNAEFFNAEEGNNNDIFYNADGGRRRRKTRRKRGKGGISSKKKSAKKTGKTKASQTARVEIEQRRLQERTQTALDFGFLPGFKSKKWDQFKTEGMEDGRKSPLVMMECSTCKKSLPKADFSENQYRKDASARRCRACVARGDGGGESNPAPISKKGGHRRRKRRRTRRRTRRRRGGGPIGKSGESSEYWKNKFYRDGFTKAGPHVTSWHPIRGPGDVPKKIPHLRGSDAAAARRRGPDRHARLLGMDDRRIMYHPLPEIQQTNEQTDEMPTADIGSVELKRSASDERALEELLRDDDDDDKLTMAQILAQMKKQEEKSKKLKQKSKELSTQEVKGRKKGGHRRKRRRKSRTNKKWWKQRRRALTRRNRRNKLLAVQRALRKNTNKVRRHIKQPSQRNCKRRRVRKNKNGTWNKKDLAHNAACLKKYMIKDNPWMLESWAQKQARKTRKKRGGGWDQEIQRPAGGWVNFPLGRYAIRFAGRNDWIDCWLVKKEDGIYRFEKTNNKEEFFECNEAAILSKQKWKADVNPQPRSGEHTPRSEKPN